ncbi:hypothetical protein MMC10_011261, partial [Thelotrema lepadinum]|nr:hypothetical protein [Thelotrema lepadinum]
FSDSVQTAKLWFREKLITYDLSDYISMKLSLDTGYFVELEQAPLSIVLARYVEYVLSDHEGGKGDFDDYTGCARVLACLVVHGEDFNEPVAVSVFQNSQITTTPWKEFLSHFFKLAFITFPEKQQGSVTKILVDKMFTLPLDHGADPNADVPCSYLIEGTCDSYPFWAACLCLVFYMPNLWQVSELYMQSLKVILRSGADVRLMMSSGSRDPEDKNSSVATPWSTFRVHLDRLANDAIEHAFHTEQRRLLAQVIIEFAKFAKDSDIPWEEIEPDLHRIFSQGQLRQILQALGRSTENQNVKLRRGAKRPTNGSYDLDSIKKNRVA